MINSDHCVDLAPNVVLVGGMEADVFIASVIATVVGFDIWLAASKRITISERMKKFGAVAAALPFLWGVLSGHFWGGDLVGHTFPLYASLPSVLLLAGGVWITGRIVGFGRYLALGWSIVGAIAGTLLWPQ